MKRSDEVVSLSPASMPVARAGSCPRLPSSRSRRSSVRTCGRRPCGSVGLLETVWPLRLFGVNWRLAAQGTNYFQATARPSPFQHYWSLSVEEQFYLCWPLLLAVVLFAVRTRERRTTARALVAALVVVIAASLWASIHVTNVSAPYGYFGTHTRVWELAVGAMIAAIADILRRLPRTLADSPSLKRGSRTTRSESV
jgi:peptidoglycan/LPS O-acetylase OafA/YrhL